MGPLTGYTIIELAGMGPAPMAGMLLADMGADVIRVERSRSAQANTKTDPSFRGKQSVVINLKDAHGIEALLRMIERADCLIDPFRPGVCEKLGLDPDTCLARNPGLVFARMTGWGQNGPLAQAAGHDINYIAITGALHAMGCGDRNPSPPLNLVGDMGGGGMLLVQGILAALLERHRSGKGQVIDAAMVDGTAQLMWMMHAAVAAGMWDEGKREANGLDGGAHFYATYECADGRYIAIGAIEPQFYAQLVHLAELDPDFFADQHNPKRWPEMKQALAAVFKSKSQAEWCDIMEGSDVCFAPVLTLTEAANHPANIARQVYVDVDGVTQPAPAPRFSRTPSQIAHGGHSCGQDTEQALQKLGFKAREISDLLASGAIG